MKRSGTANTAAEAGGCAVLHPPYLVLISSSLNVKPN